MADIPAQVLQAQAELQAPGKKIGDQDKAPMVAKDRKQPGVKKKSAAAKVYPKLANDGDGDEC
jgi:hypothetical protein